MFIFQSDLWQYSEKHILVKNLILDFFRVEEVDSINLAGLTYVISVTALGDDSDEKPKKKGKKPAKKPAKKGKKGKKADSSDDSSDDSSSD